MQIVRQMRLLDPDCRVQLSHVNYWVNKLGTPARNDRAEPVQTHALNCGCSLSVYRKSVVIAVCLGHSTGAVQRRLQQLTEMLFGVPDLKFDADPQNSRPRSEILVRERPAA